VLAAAGGALSSSTGCLGRLGIAPLSVGVAPPNRPFAVRSRCCTWETADVAGLDVDVARALGDRLGRRVEFVVRTPEALRASPSAWSFDVAMDGFVVPVDPPPGRRYVAPYLRGFHTVLVPATTTDPDALRGGTVGVVSDRAARAAAMLRAAFDGDLRIERVADGTDVTALYEALGRDLAGVVADHVTNGLVATRNESVGVLRGDGLGPEAVESPALSLGVDEYGVVVAADDPLGEDLTAALDALRSGGRLSALESAYFTNADLPRRDAV
jgi:polar amino acid transport system substrate-binding protein